MALAGEKVRQGSVEHISADSYEVLSVCGTGAYGRVLMVRSKLDGRIYAMKCVDKTNIVHKGHNSIAQAIAENELLQTMNNPYVVSLHCSFQDPVNLYMVLDYAGGGDLFALIDKRRRLPEDWVRVYGAELVLALAHCHEQGIVYRDLKPENVMVSLDGHLLLTDFGLSKRLGDPKEFKDEDLRTRTVCGTPSYMAPEALSGRPYGRAVDWWTLGCVLYEMAVGAPPFSDDALAMLVRKITSGSYQIPSWLSPELTSLLRNLLHLDPAIRLGSNSGGLDKLKAHPFFASIDWAALDRKELHAPHVPGATDTLDSDGSDAQYTAAQGADPKQGLAQLEKGFRPFERTGGAGAAGQLLKAHTALDGLSLEVNLAGTIVGISKRLARLLRVRRRQRHADEQDEAGEFIVGRALNEVDLVDARDRAALKDALATVTDAAHRSADDAEAGAESAEVTVRLWPRSMPRPTESEMAGGEVTHDVSADDAAIAEQLLAEGNAMHVARLRLEVVQLDPPDDGEALPTTSRVSRHSADNSAGGKLGSMGSVPLAAPRACVIALVTDRTGIEVAKALVHRRYRWAYDERLSELELAKVLDRSLDFEESATKASLAVSRTAAVVAGADGQGFAAYMKRRDRFITAFPDMLRTIESVEISDNGAQALTHWTWEGTHLGEYRATDYDGTLLVLAPTQARVKCSGVSIDGIRDGKIVRHQTFYDEAALRAQVTKERMTALRARDGVGSATAGALEAIRKAPSAPPLGVDVAVELIAAACGDGLALVDAAELPARYLFVNASFCQSSGYSAAELCASPAGVKILEGAVTSRGSSDQLVSALRDTEPRRVLIAYKRKNDKTFIALLALAPVKPVPTLVALWRARALYSAAIAAEAVAAEAEDDGDASRHAASLLEAARRDAALLAKLEDGRMYAMALLDMSYMPADLLADENARAADAAFGSGPVAVAARAAAAEALVPRAALTVFGEERDAPGPAFAREAAIANRGAYHDLQPSLMGVPRHMGILPQSVRDRLVDARNRPWPSATAPEHAADPPVSPSAAAASLTAPHSPAGTPSSTARGAAGRASLLDKPPPTTEQLLLRTCVDSDGYAVVISEMCSRDQPLVYINPGFAALTHYNSDDCLGHNCRFLQSNLTDPSAIMLLKWSIAAREPCRVHLLNVTRLGRPFWNLLSMHPCIEIDGRADYFLGVQVEIDANELGALLIEVHRWRRAAHAEMGA